MQSFPQVDRAAWLDLPAAHFGGLAHSAGARRFAVAARAIVYREHPILGPRLRECTSLVNAVEGTDILESWEIQTTSRNCSRDFKVLRRDAGQDDVGPPRVLN
jgi:uncharacterized protein (DUF1810 family)